jgi:peptide deformylase
MALLEVLKYPDPRLKKKSSPVEEVNEEIRKLISDMVETMGFENGIGLAATQVGVAKRVIVLDVPGERPEAGPEERRGDVKEEKGYRRGDNLIALINPVMVEASGEIRFEEGCLSVPGVTEEVKRASNVVVKGLDREGEEVEIKADGLLAVALQHEIDHIDGMLFIDRLSRLKRDIVKRKLRKAVGAL